MVPPIRGKTLGAGNKDKNFIYVHIHTLTHTHIRKGLVRHKRITCQELRSMITLLHLRLKKKKINYIDKVKNCVTDS